MTYGIISHDSSHDLVILTCLYSQLVNVFQRVFQLQPPTTMRPPSPSLPLHNVFSAPASASAPALTSTSASLLHSLNPSQRAAVSSIADTLAILAGPGSGKTHTLTARTAWLLHQGLRPQNIIVATFTVKAAREMKDRIGKLLANGAESKLVLGTFHSIARRYLARYGHLIAIPADFGIADASDSLAIIKRIVKANRFNIDPKAARARISTQKSRTTDLAPPRIPKKKSVDAQEFDQCFEEYEDALQRSNLLDYDDLLLRCAQLLRQHPSCVANVEAVLIDEFQDTNLVQLDLMRLFASQRKRITIVGDPDQSIYSFRAAEIKNYSRMLKQYPETVTIPLEENYRSSAAILLAAMAVIQQDPSREQKSLTPTHTVGTPPVFRRLARAEQEAEWIVLEIQRCLALTGTLLNLNDFAILLRSAALSRLIESELGKAGLPYRMVGGLRFYDRAEVKTVLDYLRVIDQPGNNDALARIVNVPARGIGDVTIKALLDEADAAKITLWSLILGVVQGSRASRTKLRKQAERGLSCLVNIILTAKKRLSTPTHDESAVVACIQLVLNKTNYEEWLREHHNDAHKARWDNVQELITQATDYQRKASAGLEDDSLPVIQGITQVEAPDLLSRFLANVALASHVEKDDQGSGPTAQVTISTIHAAKGLEWPIVFIPAVYQGSIPHSRADDIDEERRLLYVAMTRAQALLYMSYPRKNSQREEVTVSPFLSARSFSSHLEAKGPSFASSMIQSLALILKRALPSHLSIAAGCEHLPSREDDLFGTEGQEEVNQLEHGQDFRKGTGARPYKRPRTETTRHPMELMHPITMSRGHDTPLKRDFVTAAQLPAHGEQGPPKIPVKTKSTKHHNLGCQNTLSKFLGIPTNENSSPISETRKRSLPLSNPLLSLSARIASHAHEPMSSTQGVSPALADHRIATTFTSGLHALPKPWQQGSTTDRYRFLDSSPPRDGLVDAVNLTTSTSVSVSASASSTIPSTRPAAVMHHTSISLINQKTHARTGKQLGMRSAAGGQYAAKHVNRAFVPPSMRKRLE